MWVAAAFSNQTGGKFLLTIAISIAGSASVHRLESRTRAGALVNSHSAVSTSIRKSLLLSVKIWETAAVF